MDHTLPCKNRVKYSAFFNAQDIPKHSKNEIARHKHCTGVNTTEKHNSTRINEVHEAVINFKSKTAFIPCLNYPNQH
jgi:hypothetical protein